ncbi:hypothetical protein LK533_09230 [Sphingomonas sp. PL-96]|uniref:hypothetical protein n=1 Tax=Sphingomonas sp. PL-96 TaxID=2887201 RepID=UPI001E4FED70|nr:hypothetical protein [Sphingomonas sp. PL-96]MCC2976853.1 hypothetical protein [Sphingomonas sp. PL-96]
MKKHLIAAAMAATIVAPVAVPSAAQAQQNHHRGNSDHRWQGDRDGDWDPSQHYKARNRGERKLGRNDRIYRGNDGRAYCKRSDGTTGLVIGALGGGVLGNLLGGGTLGTLAGAGGGALLGRSVDRGEIKCR